MRRIALSLVISLGCLSNTCRAQGTFQNLGFEQANVPPVPAGQSGGFVAASNGLPGWIAYYGINQATQILHNDFTTGSVNISILGPTNGPLSLPIIEGNYSAFIQAGIDNITGTSLISAAIAQTGVIPLGTESIEFKLLPTTSYSGFAVTFAGQNISYGPISSTANYILFGGDVSSFAGQTNELRFTASPTASDPFSSYELDSIVFSTSPIPEPGTWALLLCGAAVLGLYRWRKLKMV